ncbi:hypothetical protein DSL72_006233 [Monilinia vaccinii-corymbosi]|uniref:Uncharacterized protein n=1 Tax=Monilinia vaccinii-corymbosi TaxID=61207 RepID=A0A8A3PLQ5_9HELO|nr:hypothetical protein DSL72_006233 [Monilinia vaccinii-corymbosi]
MRLRLDLATTAPAAVLQQNAGCVLVSSTLFACESISPGFTSFVPSAQASCLCYSSSTWIPTIFDHAVQTCANFASTAAPSAYPAFVNLEGFCGNLGNIQNSSGPATAATTTTTTTTTTTSTSMTSGSRVPEVSIGAVPACSTALSLIQLCVGRVPGFMNLGPTEKAACLCYASATSWIPTSFDGAVETCSQHAQSAGASAGLLSTVYGFEGICENVGDVMTMTATSRTLSATVTPNPITLPDANPITLPDASSAPLTTTSAPSPASLPRTTSSILSTIVPPPTPPIPPSTQNTRSIMKTISVITMSSRSSMITTTSSTAGLAGVGDANQGADDENIMGDLGDPMVILISFVCAVLVLFLC